MRRVLSMIVLACAFSSSACSEGFRLEFKESLAMMHYVASLDEAHAETYVRAHVGPISRMLVDLDMSSDVGRETARNVGGILVRGGCASKAALPAIEETLAKLTDDSVPLAGDLRMFPPTSTYGSLESLLSTLDKRPDCVGGSRGQ